MIIFKNVYRKFYLGAPPLPAKLISYLKTVCVTWHYAHSQSCGIMRYLYYIRLMGSQMQPKRPATWVKYSKKSGCATAFIEARLRGLKSSGGSIKRSSVYHEFLFSKNSVTLENIVITRIIIISRIVIARIYCIWISVFHDELVWQHGHF